MSSELSNTPEKPANQNLVGLMIAAILFGLAVATMGYIIVWGLS